MRSATSMVTTEKNKIVKNMYLQVNQGVEMKEQKTEEKKKNNNIQQSEQIKSK